MRNSAAVVPFGNGLVLHKKKKLIAWSHQAELHVVLAQGVQWSRCNRTKPATPVLPTAVKNPCRAWPRAAWEAGVHISETAPGRLSLDIRATKRMLFPTVLRGLYALGAVTPTTLPQSTPCSTFATLAFFKSFHVLIFPASAPSPTGLHLAEVYPFLAIRWGFKCLCSCQSQGRPGRILKSQLIPAATDAWGMSHRMALSPSVSLCWSRQTYKRQV